VVYRSWVKGRGIDAARSEHRLPRADAIAIESVLAGTYPPGSSGHHGVAAG
jgi:hypothetical protein